jgi:sugar lactone lactonase YvrE
MLGRRDAPADGGERCVAGERRRKKSKEDERGSLVPDLHTLLTGLAFGESSRWHGGRLWLSDWGTGEVIAADLGGSSEVVLRVPTAMPLCIDWLPDGRLLLVSGRDGLLLRRESDGTLATHADLTGLSRFAWNDIAVDGRGNAYVNNIGFDFPTGIFAPGILAVVTPDGAARQVADGLAFPNGMVVTPDDATLIVAESYGERLTAFDIAPDGGLANRRRWADLGGGHPDGICLDAESAIWYADVPARRCVRVREGGAVLQTIELDRGCFACALGGTGGRTLYMVAADFSNPATMAQARSGQVLTAAVSVPAPGHP